MSLISTTIQAFEGAPVPDLMRRAAIQFLVANARRQLSAAPADANAAFAREMAERPIAEHTRAANEQHYELPAAFFEKELVLVMEVASETVRAMVADLVSSPRFPPALISPVESM